MAEAGEDDHQCYRGNPGDGNADQARARKASAMSHLSTFSVIPRLDGRLEWPSLRSDHGNSSWDDNGRDFICYAHLPAGCPGAPFLTEKPTDSDFSAIRVANDADNSSNGYFSIWRAFSCRAGTILISCVGAGYKLVRTREAVAGSSSV